MSQFEKIPPELRLLIYRELFSVKEVIHVGTPKSKMSRYPNILQSNRLIYGEATEILYTETLLILHLHPDNYPEIGFRHNPFEDERWEKGYAWPSKDLVAVQYGGEELKGSMEPHVFARFRRVLICLQSTLEARYVASWVNPDISIVEDIKSTVERHPHPLAFIGKLLRRSFNLQLAGLHLGLVLDGHKLENVNVQDLIKRFNKCSEQIMNNTGLLHGCEKIKASLHATTQNPEQKCSLLSTPYSDLESHLSQPR
ncbi:hypothetical protein TSTA_109540 [Talaromyces stipitatus ATCC 10500]|uniref:F-box domain-containing protein n=1 Tax=Talaromyces stipitatus (strain ATCC 10500 / CBS 375.48 / QM 6759 / NRRL 1006) TaxID=441959 RepID=B8MU57_TALSN|nr:uncharacterized protein TSTA_109540 [Talaromyces stipitatus ATCC 10500]EED11775.1 hypothetical protein TSTA_109540 [Talaromyces stipitatus ATCC 10500]